MPTFPIVKPFDGEEAYFTEIIDLWNTAATHACRFGPHIKYEISTDNEREEMIENGEFALNQLITEPELPAEDANPNAFHIFKHRAEKYNIFLKDKHDYCQWFRSTITPAIMSHVSNVRNVDFANLSVRDMRLNLILVYGEPSHATNRAQLNILSAPFLGGDDLAAHIKKFDGIFDYFDRINDPIGDLFKYEHLVRSMATHEQYSSYISQYEISGAKNYGALSRALLAHRSELATANAVRQMHQATQHHAAAASGPITTLPGGYKLEKPTKYCWTHGITFHDGTECRKPKKGAHKADATKTERMGGSNREAMPRVVHA